MSYILRESTGCCLQDPDRHIYKSKDCKKRLKQLFYELLKESEYISEEDIDDIKKEIKHMDEYEVIEGEHYYYDGNEAWVQFKDIYDTITHLNIV